MIIILLLLGFVGIGMGVYFHKKDLKRDRWSRTDMFWGWYIFSAVYLMSIFIVIIFMVSEYTGIMVIDDKIALYQEENAEIEKEITTIVENYMDYEQETFAKFKPEATDVLVLVNTYPELKSDTMVTKQIEIYVDNQYQIKQLKEDKLDYKVLAWWLYFGGGE